MAWTNLGTVAPGDVLRANSGTAAYNNVIGNVKDIRAAQTNIVSTFKEDAFSRTTAQQTFVDITGLSVSITPSSSTSKVLITAVITCGSTGAGDYLMFKLLRGSTDIAVPTTSVGSFPASAGVTIKTTDILGTVMIQYLDSPATTSATTYKIQGRNSSANNYYVNYRGDTTTRTVSSITAQEVPV